MTGVGSGGQTKRRVPIEQVAPGMKLAKPVTNPAGLVLMAAGTELDEALIARLQKMNLSGVHIEGRPLDQGDAIQAAADLERELAERFRKVAGDPVQARIREAVRACLGGSRGSEAVPAGGQAAPASEGET